MDALPHRRSRARLLLVSGGLATVLIVAALGGISLFWRPEPDGLVFVIPAGATEALARPTIGSAIEIPTDIRFGPDETAHHGA